MINVKDDLQLLAEKVLEMVLKKGDIEAEVYLLQSQALTLEVAEKKVENMKFAEERGLGLRVITGQRLGYAYTSDLSDSALESVAEKAVHNARETEPDEDWKLPGKPASYPHLELYDEKIFQIPLEEKIQVARRIEEAAREYDPRVKITEKAVYQDSSYHLLVLNNHGLFGTYRGSYCGGYAVMVSKDDEDSQTGFSLKYGLKYREIDPVTIGREAGEKAVRMLGAQTIPSAVMPVVLDPHTMTSFLGVLQTAFSGEAVLKGKSFYQGQVGELVASPLVTIIDDGTMPDRLGSSPFDGEGVPTAKTLLLGQGKLIGFLHTTYTAGKTGSKPTGNAVRGSYKGTPEVGITNFYLAAGTNEPADMIKDVKRGLYLTDVLGMHTANPVTGDFSLGAAGLLIENGEFTSPVKGIAVAGNLRQMLQDIDAVGNDLTFFIGKGAPTVRVKAMKVSGSL